MSRSENLRVELRPSSRLAGVLALAHLGAFAAAVISLHGWSLALVAAGILLSAAVTLASALHASASTACGLDLRGDGRCAWRDRGGRWHDAEDGRRHFVSPWLIVVSLRTKPRRSKWIAVLPDSSDSESLRRLRVWLHGARDQAPSSGGRSQEFAGSRADEKT
jgi:hypothetical protein